MSYDYKEDGLKNSSWETKRLKKEVVTSWRPHKAERHEVSPCHPGEANGEGSFYLCLTTIRASSVPRSFFHAVRVIIG